MEHDVARLSEVHLYQGNRCNRACSFCTVRGCPSGWFAEHEPRALKLASRLVEPEGIIKIYGGEPTIEPEATERVMRALRDLGFCGELIIFSNGDLAPELIRLLDAAPPSSAFMNFSVWTGRDVEPISEASRAILNEYEAANPGSIIPGHEEYYASGRAASVALETRPECPRCMPAIVPDGRVHACPFAVERDHPALWLGDADTDPDVVIRRVHQFLDWIAGPHADLACELGVDPCAVCERHLHALCPPPFAG
jgi:hypothetical protein